LKKAFTQLQKTSERDSDLSGSESEEEDLHFQFGRISVHANEGETDGNQI
jgi:hypothetical protein